MKKITLQLSNGREMTFSEKELIAIVEKHLSNEDSKKATTVDVAKKPTEGKWFEINPNAIDQKLFENRREDIMQEKTRKLILEAFAEMKKYPKRYGKKFKTLIPQRYWERATVKELVDLARIIGNQNADWVIQALEWAQRIANGESWKAICNDWDTASSYRMVEWKDGYYRLVGGRAIFDAKFPASDFDRANYSYGSLLNYAVPLVVSFED